MRLHLRQNVLAFTLAIGIWVVAGTGQAGAQNFIANPNNLFFAVQVGGFGNPQQISLTSSGAQMNFTATASVSTPAGFRWLSVSSASSSTPATLNVSVSVFGLAPNNNDYTGTITVRQVGGPATLTIPIDLNVFGDRELQLDPGILTFVSNNGGAPEDQQIGVTAAGTHPGELAFSTSVVTADGGNWLTVTPSQATTTRVVTVRANISGLAPDDHNAVITFTDTANRPTSVGVALLFHTNSTPAISLSQSSLGFWTSPGATPSPRNVQITNSAGGTLNWTAAASTQTGGNWLGLGPVSGTAPSTLTVSVNGASLAKGSYTGTATIRASGASNTPQVINVTAAVGVPLVNDKGVINGASFSTSAVVSASSIASLFGQGLATDIFRAETIPLPTSLGGTQVLVNDVPAPLFFVSPSQINFQIPAGLSGATATIAVSLNGSRGPNNSIALGAAVPGIFTVNQNGLGQGAVLNQDFSFNSSSNPEARGNVIQIYCTGLGATNPPVPSGQAGAASEPLNRTVATPIVLIGGIPATVTFSAIAPNFVGLYQVNAIVPPGVAPGSAVSLQLQMGGVSSNTATVAIR